MRVKLYCWFSVDVTKIQTTKLSTLLRFYFHDVLKGLKTILVKRSFCISFVRRKRKWKFSLEISNSPLLGNMQIHYLVFFIRSLYSFIYFFSGKSLLHSQRNLDNCVETMFAALLSSTKRKAQTVIESRAARASVQSVLTR